MAGPRESVRSERAGGGPRFRWPPRRTGDVPTTAEANIEVRAAGGPRLARPKPSLWSAIEEAFLDVTAGPLPRRAEGCGWQPDAPAAYCGRCGLSVGPGQAGPEGCGKCRGVALAWDRMVRLGVYAPPLRTWVHEMKYTRWRRLGEDLGQLLGRAVAAQWIGGAEPVVVPVPDAWLRRIARGIDHAAVIARGVSRETGWPVRQFLMRRLGPSQVSVTPSERGANVGKMFAIRMDISKDWLTRPIVLVDDVCTTGATLRTCSRLLRKAAAGGGSVGRPEIWTAVVARAEVKGR